MLKTSSRTSKAYLNVIVVLGDLYSFDISDVNITKTCLNLLRRDNPNYYIYLSLPDSTNHPYILLFLVIAKHFHGDPVDDDIHPTRISEN